MCKNPGRLGSQCCVMFCVLLYWLRLRVVHRTVTIAIQQPPRAPPQAQSAPQRKPPHPTSLSPEDARRTIQRRRNIRQARSVARSRRRAAVRLQQRARARVVPPPPTTPPPPPVNPSARFNQLGQEPELVSDAEWSD